jgi:hypothetical protein
MSSSMAFFVRERWFEIGLKFFAAGALITLAMVALMWLPQLRVIAAIAFVQAALGVALCVWGLRVTASALRRVANARPRVGPPDARCRFGRKDDGVSHHLSLTMAFLSRRRPWHTSSTRSAFPTTATIAPPSTSWMSSAKPTPARPGAGASTNWRR